MASLFDRIQRSIIGRDIGLDRNNNLLLRGSTIYLNSDSASPVAITGTPSFSSSVSASPAASVNNYAPAGWGPTVTRLMLAAAAGGSTVTGLDATGVVDGTTRIVVNTSTTDSLTFPHLSGSSLAANRFSNAGAVAAQIAPLGAALLTYVVNQWVFA